jgi:hypothetical protein
LWTTTFPISGSSFLPTHCQPFCLSSLCLQLLALPPSPVHFQSSCPLCCLLVFSSLFIQGFLCMCVCVRGSVCPGDYAGLSQEWLGKYHMMLGAHLFGLPNVSQAGLELASGGSGTLPVFSFCNVVWRSFL